MVLIIVIENIIRFIVTKGSVEIFTRHITITFPNHNVIKFNALDTFEDEQKLELNYSASSFGLKWIYNYKMVVLASLYLHSIFVDCFSLKQSVSWLSERRATIFQNILRKCFSDSSFFINADVLKLTARHFFVQIVCLAFFLLFILKRSFASKSLKTFFL